MNKKKALVSSAAMALAAIISYPAFADPVYTHIDLASYANNNIYTNLNQNFPNTGAGTPGSGTGVANASFVFMPWSYTPPAAAATGMPYTSYSAPLGNNGVSFQLNSNAAGQDFDQITSPQTVTIGVNNVTTVYALVGAYNGASFTVVFNGTGGTESFTVSVPDFFNASINSCTANVCDQTVYTVTDQGAAGTGNSTTGFTGPYDLTELAFTLDSSLDDLLSATLQSTNTTLLLGLTTASPQVTAAPEPTSLALLGTGIAGLWLRRRRGNAKKR